MQTTVPSNDGMNAPGEAVGRAWFGTAIEALLPKLMGAALRLARNRADAEDLVAEAVSRGWTNLESLESREALGAWLCRILTNTYISQQRTLASRVEKEPYRDVAAGPEEQFSLFERLHQPFLLWQNDPEKRFLDRLLREDIEAAIDALPDPFRIVVVLVDVQGFSYAEASDSLEVPVGTIRSRLARGRSRLQESLWAQAVDAGYREPTSREPDDPNHPSAMDGQGNEDE